MENPKTQKISFRLPLEDYGWLIRYADKNDMTTSQVLRKALRMYRAAIVKAKEAKDGKEQ